MILLEEHGQYKPIVAQHREDEPHVIVAGNHVYEAARQLGWDGIAATVLPMSDRQALKVLLSDNHSYELGYNDSTALARILAELKDDLAGTAYDSDDVDDLLHDVLRTLREPIEAPITWRLVVDLDDEQARNVLMADLMAQGYRVRSL